MPRWPSEPNDLAGSLQKVRWAPYDRDHDPGQGQLPGRSYRPWRFTVPDEPRSHVNLGDEGCQIETLCLIGTDHPQNGVCFARLLASLNAAVIDAMLSPKNRPQIEHSGPRPVILTAGGPLSWIVVNGLVRCLGPITVIQEQPETKLEIIRRRARLLGWIRAIGQVAFGLFERLFLRNSSRLAAISAKHSLVSVPNAAIEVHHVSSVNSPECHALLAELKPPVVGVYGTRILKRATLKCLAAPFINYHAGINPKYRGQHPGYWALASGDAENAGVTIHLVDEGVDTGGVLYQARVHFESEDTISTYQHVQAAFAIPLFARALEDAIAGRLNPKEVDLPSQQFFPPTLWAYFGNGFMKGVW